MLKKVVFILSFLSYGSGLLNAQTVGTTSQTLPDWVAMIDNPNANYYEAVKAFDDYWKNKVKPLDEMESGKEAEEEAREFKEYVIGLSVSERNYFDQLCYHHKRFKRWKEDVLPFVQDSGRILTQEELQAIWQKQQNEMQNQKR